MAAKKRKPEKARRAARCRECGGGTIKREITLKGGLTTIAWRCTGCDAVWSDRRTRP